MNIDFTGIFISSFLENFIPILIALMPFLLCLLVPAVILSYILKSNDAWKMGGFLGLLFYFTVVHEQTLNLL